MVRREDYARREQAYVKHYVLKHYLRQLALKIGNFRPGTTLNYIDGFSGPWQHATEELRDTSPHVALTELCAAREFLRGQPRPVDLRIRGMFVERDGDAYERLVRLLRDTFPLVECDARHGELAAHIPRRAASPARDRGRSRSSSSIPPGGPATACGRSRRSSASARARS